MEFLMLGLNAVILIVLLVLVGQVRLIKKALTLKKEGPNDEDTTPPLPTSQEGGDPPGPNDPPQDPPLPT